jgi:hypothetical protein
LEERFNKFMRAGKRRGFTDAVVGGVPIAVGYVGRHGALAWLYTGL